MAKLSDEEVAGALAALPGWQREERFLVRTVAAESFLGAVELINAIARVAEARNHHPDIHLSWRTLILRLTSHDAGGLTRRDLELARALMPLLHGR